MTDLALHGAVVHGAVDQACTLDPNLGSTAEARVAALGSRACTVSISLDPSGLEAAQPFYKVAPPWVGYSFRPGALAPAARGYATASSSGPVGDSPSGLASAACARPRPAPARSRPDELAFLDDKSLSVEDKLMRFMALVMQKADRELVEKMKGYEAKKKAQEAKEGNGSASAGQSAGGGGGGGLFGAIGDLLGGGGNLLGGLGGALGGGGNLLGGLSGAFGGGGDMFGALGGALGIGGMGGAAGPDLLKDLGGPVLAAVCSAVGLPFLAPIAMKLGNELGSLAGSAAGAAGGTSSQQSARGTAASSSEGAGKSSGAASEEGFDERLEMMKLQRLVDKQNTMFQALSNVLKSMHDAQMTAVGNIR